MAHATKSSGGKYTKLYHMDSKAEAATYAQGLPALKGKFSQIQAPIYFQVGTEWGLPIAPKKVMCRRKIQAFSRLNHTKPFKFLSTNSFLSIQQPDGTYRMIAPGPGHKPIPFGNVRTDLGPCVKALVEEAPPNTNLFAVGDYLSWTDYLRIVCETQGLKYGGFDELSYDEINELIPGGLGHEFGLNVLFAFEFGYEGNEPGIVGPGKVSSRIQTLVWSGIDELTWDYSMELK